MMHLHALEIMLLRTSSKCNATSASGQVIFAVLRLWMHRQLPFLATNVVNWATLEWDVPSRTWTGGIDQVIEVDASIVDRMDILLGNVQQFIRGDTHGQLLGQLIMVSQTDGMEAARTLMLLLHVSTDQAHGIWSHLVEITEVLIVIMTRTLEDLQNSKGGIIPSRLKMTDGHPNQQAVIGNGHMIDDRYAPSPCSCMATFFNVLCSVMYSASQTGH